MFIPNDTSVVGSYYILDTDEYTDVVVGPPPTIPGMRGTVLAGMASPIIEPTILKVHAPPFLQEVQDGEDPETGLMEFREVALVFVTDRDENLYLVHWNPEGCHAEWKDIQEYRFKRFEAMKLHQYEVFLSVSERTAAEYITRLAQFEDAKEAQYQYYKNKAAEQAKLTGKPPIILYTPDRAKRAIEEIKNKTVKPISKFSPPVRR